MSGGKSKIISFFLGVMLFFLSLPFNAQAKSTALTSEPTIAAGILRNAQSVKISAAFNYVFAEEKYPANTELTIINKNGVLVINGKSTKNAEINLIPTKAAVKQKKYINVNKAPYRGEIKIRANGKNGTVTVINTLLLEEYLYGVIKNEIPPEWAMEAVKAQAVAARNYALTQRGKHKNEGFDVCNTTDCQVYGGQRSETARVIQAVNETRGIVLTHAGQLITAYYHSSSGGYTEHSENVWVTSVPYLRGVVDFDQNSPQYKWEKQFTLADFSAKLKNAGQDIGVLKSIGLSKLSKQPVKSADRGISGRVKTAKLTGTKGTGVFDGAKLRSVLGLNSTLFDLNLVSSKNGQYVVVTGFGLGHGAGMSQWGAKAMAEKAGASKKNYYQEILRHYYTNTSIDKIY